MASLGYDPSDAIIVAAAGEIYNSSQMNEIRQSHKKGVPVDVIIGKYKIQSTALPFTGCTAFGSDGFLIGTEALASEVELKRTLLHQLHLLHHSNPADEQARDRDTKKVDANAIQFAERFYNSI
jgi:hypothetical protein